MAVGANLQDLVGKKVNFNTQGTAGAYSGPLIFSRLGINVEKTFIPIKSRWSRCAKARWRPIQHSASVIEPSESERRLSLSKALQQQ